MIKHFIRKVHNRRSFASPQVIICVPSSSTAVERRAIQESAESAGARRVFLIEEPMAAAIGANLPVTEPTGSAWWSTWAAAPPRSPCSPSAASSTRARCASAATRWTRASSPTSAAPITCCSARRAPSGSRRSLGSACPPEDGDGETLNIKGRDLMNGVPKEIVISKRQISESLAEPVGAIIDAVKVGLENTAPELAADIVDKGIVLTGGGSLLGNLDYVLRHATGLPVSIADQALALRRSRHRPMSRRNEGLEARPSRDILDFQLRGPDSGEAACRMEV